MNRTIACLSVAVTLLGLPWTAQATGLPAHLLAAWAAGAAVGGAVALLVGRSLADREHRGTILGLAAENRRLRQYAERLLMDSGFYYGERLESGVIGCCSERKPIASRRP